MRTLLRLLLVGIVVLACSRFSGGDSALVGSVAPELRPGHWVVEPPAKTLAELRGKPVLLEFWGTY